MFHHSCQVASLALQFGADLFDLDSETYQQLTVLSSAQLSLSHVIMHIKDNQSPVSSTQQSTSSKSIMDPSGLLSSSAAAAQAQAQGLTLAQQQHLISLQQLQDQSAADELVEEEDDFNDSDDSEDADTAAAVAAATALAQQHHLHQQLATIQMEVGNHPADPAPTLLVQQTPTHDSEVPVFFGEFFNNTMALS
jgi:hypothetical protein